MGVAGSKKLPKEDMQFLMDNTNFTKQQIKAWYKGFMVSAFCLAPDLYMPLLYMYYIERTKQSHRKSL